MKVSVIIPVYNAEKYIEATINSVLQQSYPKELIEIIIVNDGSTDGTVKILERYENLSKIIHTKNRGVSYARNIGIENATGDFIQYLDSDDLLCPEKIELQVAALVKEQADVAYGNWDRFVEENGYISITETIERSLPSDAALALFTNFWCPPAALLYSRGIVNKIEGFKNWLNAGEDARYFLDAALNDAKFVYSPFLAAHYRHHETGSLSTKNKLKFTEDIYKNIYSIYKLWKVGHQLNSSKLLAIQDGIAICIQIFSGTNSRFFNHAVDLLLKINPSYLPPKNNRIYFLCLIIGYRNAVVLKKNIKNLLQ